MRGGHTLESLCGGGYSPDKALLEDISIRQHTAAEMTVEYILRVGVRLECGGISLFDQRSRKALQKAACELLIFSYLKEDSSTLGDTELERGDVYLLCEYRARFLGVLGGVIRADGGYLTALGVNEIDLLFSEFGFSKRKLHT